MNILVIVAHSDDELIGAGGTLVEYAKQGHKIYVVIFSYGEKSNLILKEEVLTKVRIKETEKSGKIIMADKTIFFGIPDIKISKFVNDELVIKSLKKIIQKYNPERIFTHSSSDIHPDHKAVNIIVNKTLNKFKNEIKVFTFDVWNPLTMNKTNYPILYTDITNSFKTKLKALKIIKSQKLVIFQLMPWIYLRALINGLNNNCKYAERFYQVR